MKDFKRTISFVDNDRVKTKIEIEIRSKDSGKQFSMSGAYAGSYGQIVDHIKPATEAQQKLVDLWNKYHLNDMNAGTEEQEAALKSEEFTQYWEELKLLTKLAQESYDDLMIDKRVKGQNYNVSKHLEWERKMKAAKKKGRPIVPEHYAAARAFLKSKKLLKVPHPDYPDGYDYGSAWLHRSLPKDIEEQVNTVCDEIEEYESSSKGKSLVDMDDAELLEFIEANTTFEDRDAELCAAFVRMFDLGENDLDDVEINGERCCVQGTDYIAGNDEEMTEAVTESIKQTLWAFNANFLASMTDMPEKIFSALQDQCEDANDAVEACIDKTCGIEEFVEAAVRADGRGHFLNSYDGGELEQSINGTLYFACRN